MPEQPGTLRDMIKAAHASGLTYDQLGERAVDPETGKRASGAFINKVANGNVDRMPYDHHLRAIAVALGVSYAAVRQAAITQWLPAEHADAERQEMIRELRELRDQAEAALTRLGDDTPESESA